MVLILHSIIVVLIVIELLELISSCPCSIYLTTLLLLEFYWQGVFYYLY